MKFLAYMRQHPLYWLLLVIPLALTAHYLAWGDMAVFILTALAVIPLAGMIGNATESLAVYTGPRIGGLLNATLGNAAELIITLVAVKAGLLDLVKASITGSILGNLLLVLGFSMLLGGLKHGTQIFDRRQASNHAILLTITVVALTIPSFFGHSIEMESFFRMEELSLGVAIIMILLYGLGLYFTFKSTSSPLTYTEKPNHEHEKPELNLTQSLVMLIAATVGVVWMSELLVGAVEEVVVQFGMSEFFLGIILIPIVGNVAEHLVAVQMALRNKMELSVEIAVSSSTQVALFVAPLLVFVSIALGHPLTLMFNSFELMALGAGVIITVMVSTDGESTWFEGAALLAVYLILGLAFFFLPA